MARCSFVFMIAKGNFMYNRLTRLRDAVVRSNPGLHAVQIAIADYEYQILGPQ